MMKPVRLFAGGLIQIVTYVFGVASFLVVFFASSVILDAPSMMIALGLLASFIVTVLGSYLAGMLFKLRRTWRFACIQGFGAGTVFFGLFYLIALQPLIPKPEQFVRSLPNGVELWELSTGSKIAVRKVTAGGPEKREPIIFLHGGPGAYSVDLQQTVVPISQLRLRGHDVYFYDQIGGGLSARLDDVSHYSLDRHMADLEAIHAKIGSPKIILIGSSFGATLSAQYMAKNPSHVSKAVFTSSGPIFKPDWPDGSDGSLDQQMRPEQRTEFNQSIMRPRLLAAMILSDINPTAAGRFWPEREAGSFFDKIANDHYMEFTVCDVENVEAKTSGFGFWSNRITGKTLETALVDPKPLLRQNQTPVLIIRGDCDYKSEAVSEQYVAIFPNSEMLSFEGAGHMFYWEQPEVFVAAVSNFLEGR